MRVEASKKFELVWSSLKEQLGRLSEAAAERIETPFGEGSNRWWNGLTITFGCLAFAGVVSEAHIKIYQKGTTPEFEFSGECLPRTAGTEGLFEVRMTEKSGAIFDNGLTVVLSVPDRNIRSPLQQKPGPVDPNIFHFRLASNTFGSTAYLEVFDSFTNDPNQLVGATPIHSDNMTNNCGLRTSGNYPR